MNDMATHTAVAPSALQPVLKAVRKAGGRVTLGDAVAATGLGRDEVEASLRALLETRRGHLEVGERGTLVYRFDPRLIRRNAQSVWVRIRQGTWELFTQAFKVWIVLMLLVYFVVFVALLIAAIVASQSRGGGRGGRRIGGRHLGLGGLRGFWFWYIFWSPGWGFGGRRRPYYGHRWERRYASRKGAPRVPFIKKVFAFVFGPDRPRPTQLQRDRSILRLIRARRGVLTGTELVQHTGLPLHDAEEEMARLMASHGGDVEVSDGGVLTYVFPELMVSAKGPVSEEEPDPAWRRLEPAESVTGNDAKSNAIIAGINGFNLLAAATAPWFIFPRLGFAGDLAWVGLVWVPLVFSSLFFAIPALRAIRVRRRNRLRRERNLRKLLLGHVFRASLTGNGAGWVTVAGAREHVRAALPGTRGRRTGDLQLTSGSDEEPAIPAEPSGNGRLEEELQRLLAEFDGEVREEAEGTVRYRFPSISLQFRGAESVRRRLNLDRQEVGDIVYASDQSEEEAHERDLAAFDRELAGAEEELTRYLQAPHRAGYLDEFELVAFDEELERSRR